MAAPSINDLRKYIGVILGSAPWNYNLSQIVAFLTTNYDLAGNNITATQFFGDISNCTGFPNLNVDVVAGEGIVAGDAVRIDSGAAFLCTTSSAGITNFIGIATNNASTGQTVSISRYAYSEYISLVTDDTYYISTDGAITNTKPGTYAKPIGFAISDTELILSPNSEANTTFSEVNVTGGASIGGNLSVNTDKFTVDGATGNTDIAGDFDVAGVIGSPAQPYLLLTDGSTASNGNITNFVTTTNVGGFTVESGKVTPPAPGTYLITLSGILSVDAAGVINQVSVSTYDSGDSLIITTPIISAQTRGDDYAMGGAGAVTLQFSEGDYFYATYVETSGGASAGSVVVSAFRLG